MDAQSERWQQEGMTPTPRVDAATIGFAPVLVENSPDRFTTTELVDANFARILERELAEAIKACQASLEYDAAIRRRGFMGEVKTDSGEREHYTTGDDLDSLYGNWINRARAFLQRQHVI